MNISQSTYQLSRPYIQTGDLLEWRSPRPIGIAIRLKTRKIVNHSSMALWNQSITNIDAKSPGPKRLYIEEAIPSGFRLTYLSAELKSYKG